jgi:hypothetical protein
VVLVQEVQQQMMEDQVEVVQIMQVQQINRISGTHLLQVPTTRSRSWFRYSIWCSRSPPARGGGGAGAAGQTGPGSGPARSRKYGSSTHGVGPTAPSYRNTSPTGSTRYFAGGGAGGGSPEASTGSGTAGTGGEVAGWFNFYHAPAGPSANAIANTWWWIRWCRRIILELLQEQEVMAVQEL